MAEAVLDPARVAVEVLAAYDARRSLEPFVDRVAGLDPTTAPAVTAALAALRKARGERVVGRKIGFTNRGIWGEYGVSQPIWGHVWDTMLIDAPDAEAEIAADRFVEPRIEPEVVLGLDGDIDAGMGIDEIAQRIGWVAHGFEIVQSHFPGWRFSVADCIADGGLHGALIVGPRRHLAGVDRRGLAKRLSGVALTLFRDGEIMDRGTGANVLDGPIQALSHVAQAIAGQPSSDRLAAGEIVTTGTLTRAFPVVAGEVWNTGLESLDGLSGLSLRIV